MHNSRVACTLAGGERQTISKRAKLHSSPVPERNLFRGTSCIENGFNECGQSFAAILEVSPEKPRLRIAASWKTKIIVDFNSLGHLRFCLGDGSSKLTTLDCIIVFFDLLNTTRVFWRTYLHVLGGLPGSPAYPDFRQAVQQPHDSSCIGYGTSVLNPIVPSSDKRFSERVFIRMQRENRVDKLFRVGGIEIQGEVSELRF